MNQKREIRDSLLDFCEGGKGGIVSHLFKIINKQTKKNKLTKGEERLKKRRKGIGKRKCRRIQLGSHKGFWFR
jgi:hypothetical protein